MNAAMKLSDQFLGKPVDYKNLTQAEIENLDLPDRFVWAATKWGKDAALTTSFGDTSVVSLDLWANAARTLEQKLKVIAVDTHTIHHETLQYAHDLMERYKDDLDFHIYAAPNVSPLQLMQQHGRFWQDQERLLEVNKSLKDEPLGRAFDELGVQVWVSGLARDCELEDRKIVPLIGISHKFGGDIFKVSPLFDHDKSQVRAYMAAHNLPANPAGMTEWYRAEGKKFCGIHYGDAGTAVPVAGK